MSPTTSPFGPLAVLVDPRAGNGAVAREVGAVEHALEARGLEYRLHVGDSSEELGRLSAAALDEGYRFLAAVGDDATVQDVVNGMFREGRPIVDAPVLGVVAAGSGSDLPLSFGLGYVMLREDWPPINFFVSGEWMAYRRNAPVAPHATVRFGMTFGLADWRPW